MAVSAGTTRAENGEKNEVKKEMNEVRSISAPGPDQGCTSPDVSLIILLHSLLGKIKYGLEGTRRVWTA